MPMSSEYDTGKTVNARLWPWYSLKSFQVLHFCSKRRRGGEVGMVPRANRKCARPLALETSVEGVRELCEVTQITQVMSSWDLSPDHVLIS